jgi:hypothetical protein
MPANPKILNNRGFRPGSRLFFYAQNAIVAAGVAGFRCLFCILLAALPLSLIQLPELGFALILAGF